MNLNSVAHTTLSLTGLVLAVALAVPAHAQLASCFEAGERVGLDEAARAGKLLGSSVPARIKYLVRIDAECLLSKGLRQVEAVSVFWNGDTPSQVCTPWSTGKAAEILYGSRTRGIDLNVNGLSKFGVTVQKVGIWEDYPLPRTLAVQAGFDIVLGVSVEQRKNECPLTYSAPFTSSGKLGSYLQIAERDRVTWTQEDCNRNGNFDVVEGYAFHVREKLCDVSRAFSHDNLHWKIRAKGRLQASTPATPGRLFVTDYQNSRVHVYSPDLTLQTTWGTRGTQPGQLIGPSGIALDRERAVYVADLYNNRVQVFDSGGRPLRSWAVDRPESLAIDCQGNVFVTTRSSVRVYDRTTGRLLRQWGSFGKKPGQFGGSVSGIDVSPDGRLVFVADTGNSRIQIFQPTGTLVRSIARFGTGPGLLSFPTGIAQGPGGNLYVIDHGSFRIKVFDLNGHEVGLHAAFKAPPGNTAPQGLAWLGPSLYHTDWFGHTVRRFNTGGTLLGQAGSQGTGPGSFRHPADVATPLVCP